MELIQRREPRNQGVRIVKKIFILIAVVFCLFQAFQWEINFLFNENLEVEKGSLKYYLTFPPRMVRKAPIISRLPDTKTGYSYSVGDGNAPGYEGIHYQSSESKSIIENQFMEYLAPRGYTLISKEIEKGENGEWERNRLIFTSSAKPGTEAVVHLLFGPGKKAVSVEFTAYHW